MSRPLAPESLRSNVSGATRPSIGLLVDPQLRLAYDDLRSAAREAEEAGFDAFYVSDHYGHGLGGIKSEPADAWALLAGLARDTDRIRLGSLVSPVTFRRAASLAIVALTANRMSYGRIDVGLGAGWDATEHQRFELPFPPLRDRLSMLGKQLQVMRRLSGRTARWTSAEQASVGRAAAPTRSDCPRIIVGGRGGARSLAIAAEYADEYDLIGASPERAAIVFDHLDRACRAIERTPASIRRSAVVGLLIGDGEASYTRRRAEVREMLGGAPGADAWINERRPFWVHGGPNDLVRRLAEYDAAGCDAVVLEDFLGRDSSMIRLVGDAIRSTRVQSSPRVDDVPRNSPGSAGFAS